MSALPAAADLSAGDLTQQVLTLVLSLAFIVALIVGGAALLKKFGGVQRFSQQQLKSVAGLSLGGRDRVVLIEANGQQLLLGVSPGNVRLLHCFDGEQSFAAALKSQFPHKTTEHPT